MSLFGIPYSAIKSTLGTSEKYMQAARFIKPHLASMAAGAAVGAGTSMASGDNSMFRDAALGAAGGFALNSGGINGIKSARSASGIGGRAKAFYGDVKASTMSGWAAAGNPMYGPRNRNMMDSVISRAKGFSSRVSERMQQMES